MNRNSIVAIVIAAILAAAGGWWLGARSAESEVVPAVEPVDPGFSAEELPPAPAKDSAARWEDWTGTSPAWPLDLESPRECAAVDQEWLRVCRRLDSQESVRERMPSGGVCTLVRDVVTELAADPPVLAGELKSLPAFLGNVHHLFRVVGAQRLLLLRDLLRAEGADQEMLAFVGFRWLVSREKCDASGKAAISVDRLYEYAGYLTQTMGGQAYLRRRAPSTEALAGFYSLVILDLSVEEGFNSEGLDPRPEIERVRALIATQEFLFEEQYLHTLSEMSRRWKEREAR